MTTVLTTPKIPVLNMLVFAPWRPMLLNTVGL